MSRGQKKSPGVRRRISSDPWTPEGGAHNARESASHEHYTAKARVCQALAPQKPHRGCQAWRRHRRRRCHRHPQGSGLTAPVSWEGGRLDGVPGGTRRHGRWGAQPGWNSLAPPGSPQRGLAGRGGARGEGKRAGRAQRPPLPGKTVQRPRRQLPPAGCAAAHKRLALPAPCGRAGQGD